MTRKDGRHHGRRQEVRFSTGFFGGGGHGGGRSCRLLCQEWCQGGAGRQAKWGFERDDDLPLLCMEVSGGAVVAATGDGWAPNGDFVQLHLGGGSIPGTQVKSVTSETAGTRLTVVLESGGVSTLDLVWTEWRLTPPAGVDVASVSSLFLDYGDGNAVELDQLLVADGDEAPDSNGRPVA